MPSSLLQSLDQKIELAEMFVSIQGESSLAGIPTTFIRTARCNLRCHWCDTTYSFSRGYEYSIDTLLQQVRMNGWQHVCVTGGEPLLQPHLPLLLSTLCDEGYRVSLETGGSLSTERVDARVVVILDVKCPGSGMERRNAWENLKRLKPQDEVKFVLLDRKDYDWAKGICDSFSLWTQPISVLFSPVHGHLVAKELVEWVLQDKLPVRINLQIHKWIWPPNTRGV